MKKAENFNEAQKPNLRLGAVISRIFFGLLILVVSVNVGKWLGIGLFKLIMWLGILPYLEKFFGWFVF
jgi:membrane-associated HD superfamily phosphohydrolase